MSETETETQTTPDEQPAEAQPDEVQVPESDEGAEGPPGEVTEPTEPSDEPEPGAAPEEQPDAEQPEPTEPTGASFEDLQRAIRPVERAIKSYAERIHAYITEHEQPLIPCGVCAPDFPGFIYSPFVKPLNEDQKKFARELIGMPDEPPYVQANDAHMCNACKGWGQVLTGSQRNDQRTRKCFACDGRGWEGAGAQEARVTNGHAGAVAVTLPEQAPADVPESDPWGRTPDHPGYYKMPHPGMPAHELPPGYAPVAG